MNKIAIAFCTKDRVHLSKRTIEPLLQPDKFDLWWFDGSATKEGVQFASSFCALHPAVHKIQYNVRGGPDAAVAYALSTLLDWRNIDLNPDTPVTQRYEYIGLVENDVLLSPNWFDRTFELFQRGRDEGLAVGAVSARAYEDRILFQRDGYAVMHNLGWGMQIMTREAAALTLANMRTWWTTEPRNTFAILAGLDIGRWWAFKGGEHMLCTDWGNDALLARHGMCSLALTPSPVEMIGQEPPLAEQGLALAKEPVEALRNAELFLDFAYKLHRIRAGNFVLPQSQFLRESDGGYLFFAHQIGALGGTYTGNWGLKWGQGFGPFGWCAVSETLVSRRVTIPVFGPCSFLVSGGPNGGDVEVADTESGYTCPASLYPLLPESPQAPIMSISVPAGCSYRPVRLHVLSPGVTFHGLRTRLPQPIDPDFHFNHSLLPPVET